MGAEGGYMPPTRGAMKALSCPGMMTSAISNSSARESLAAERSKESGKTCPAEKWAAVGTASPATMVVRVGSETMRPHWPGV